MLLPFAQLIFKCGCIQLNQRETNGDSAILCHQDIVSLLEYGHNHSTTPSLRRTLAHCSIEFKDQQLCTHVLDIYKFVCKQTTMTSHASPGQSANSLLYYPCCEERKQNWKSIALVDLVEVVSLVHHTEIVACSPHIPTKSRSWDGDDFFMNHHAAMESQLSFLKLSQNFCVLPMNKPMKDNV